MGQSLRRDQGSEKSVTPQTPPTAKEVTLHKISTPLSLDRTLQPAIFGALKKHFESKKRIVKSADIIGVSVDEGLGRIVFSGGPGAFCGDEDIALQLSDASETLSRTVSSKHKRVNVAWFRVSNIIFEAPDSQDPDIIHQAGVTAAAWGGIALIDVSSTRMVTAGSQTCKIPGTLSNPWELYLGVKRLPRIHQCSRSSAAAMASWTGGLASVKDLTNRPVFYSPEPEQRVKELVAAATSSRAVRLGMPPVVILLISTQRGIGKATIATKACADIGLHVFDIDAYDILTEGGANGGSNAGGGGDVKTEAYLKARADRALACGASSTALLIRHIDVLGADRMISAIKEVISQSRVVIATTTEIDKVAEGIRAACTHEFEVTAPEEKEREGILRNVVHDMGVKIAPEVDLAQVAVKTAALVAGDLVDVVERAVAGRTLRLERLAAEAAKRNDEESTAQVISIKDILVAGGPAATCLTKADFDNAVEHARKSFADSIGAPKIPNVSWDDVGGLSHVKDAVSETIQLPLERPELFAKGMKKRSGILFYGPPGTGKTLLAKAIATEFSLNFFSVKGPELLNMYIGESEANVRRVFQRARDARPCCVFFDELDSVAPKRGNQGDSGGVMDRIVSQLLAELDGMSGGSGSSEGGDGAGEGDNGGGGGVFVIGATNRPDLLDPALLRPGRFDKMLYLGVSDTHAKQATILEALTRKFTLDSGVDLNRVADRLPLTYTGADLYALCSDAMLKAVTRKANAVDERIKKLAEEGVVGPAGGPVSTAWFFDHLATPDDISVMVSEDDFSEAQAELVASVSAKELEHFERIRRQFESNAKEEVENEDKGPEKIGLKQTVANFLSPDGFDGLTDGYTLTIGDMGKGKGKAVVGDEDDADD
ncbi:peroxisomal assembly protein [Ascosphaera aggregata]|nr:peroxisomal assembly protein [Ascosphaera aggregata]